MTSPPPPPAPPSPSASNQITSARRSREPSGQDPVDVVCRRWSYLSQEYPVALVKYFDLNPIIQQGPQCGLVALVMVANALGRNVDVEEVLHLAREKGFSNFGEIFDVSSMRQLCSKVVGRVSTVIPFPKKSTMIEEIIKGKVFLVPYDADSNHEPCQRNGRSAHWAVIFGVLLMRPECYCLEGLEKLSARNPIYRAELGYDCELDGDDFLFARQGKSRHVAVWKYEDLRDSCLQLNEASDKYEGMILPKGGIQQGLKGKVLRVEL